MLVRLGLVTEQFVLVRGGSSPGLSDHSVAIESELHMRLLLKTYRGFDQSGDTETN